MGNDRNNKLTGELVVTQDSYNRDRKFYDIELAKQNQDIHALSATLGNVNNGKMRLANERNEILSIKDFETNRLRQETDRIADELHFERTKRMEFDTMDR